MKSLRLGLILTPSARGYSRVRSAPTAASSPLAPTIPAAPAIAVAAELTPKHIAQVVAHQPQLGQYDAALWHRTYGALSSQGFSTSAFQRIISGRPPLLTWQPAALQQSIECWRGASQFGDRRVAELLQTYPQLFELRDERLLGHRLSLLQPYAGTPKNIWQLLMNAPNLLTDRTELIDARIAYVSREMRADVPDVIKSKAFAHSIESLRTRHVFLDRLGVFKRRSLKVKNAAVLEAQQQRNPRMHAIYDSADAEFAQRVGGVSLDEWEVFQQLYAVELERAGGAMVMELGGEMAGQLDEEEEQGDGDEEEEEEQVAKK